MKKRAAIYSRVSTNTGKQKTDRQVTDLIKYANSCGYTVDEVDIYEEYISGYKKFADRPELSRLRNVIDNDKTYYSAVFVWEISRIARDPEQCTNIVNYFNGNNIPIYVKEPEVRSLKENGERDPMFNILLTILMEFANTEAIMIKKRSRSGLRQKASEGNAVAFINYPYGYCKGENKKLVIDDEEAEVIRKIFDLSIKGYGTKKIANVLNADGILTRYQKKYTNPIKYKSGKPPTDPQKMTWKDGTIYTILTNEIYKGRRRIIKNPDDIDTTEIGTPKDTYDYFTVPAIVTEEIWDQAHVNFKNNLRHSIRNAKFSYVLKGLIKCSCCGGSYYGRLKTDGKDKFYMCSTKRTRSRECTNKGVSIAFLESIVWNRVKIHLRSDHFKKYDKKNAEQVENIELLRKQVSTSEQKRKETLDIIKNAKDLLVKQILTAEEYAKYHTQYTNDLKKIESLIEKQKTSIQQMEKYVIDYDDVQELKKRKFAIDDDRIEMAKVINSIVESVNIFTEDGRFYFITINTKMVTTNGNIKIDLLGDKKLKQWSPIKHIGKIGNVLKYDEYGRITTGINELSDLAEEFAADFEPLKMILLKAS